MDTAGNLYPVKGQTYLLQAIPLVLRECPNTMFVFASREKFKETFKKEAAELGVEDHVHFLGFVAVVQALLNTLDGKPSQVPHLHAVALARIDGL